MAKLVSIIGLGFGDEGKGSVVDALCRGVPGSVPSLVVRHNGGSQAAHNVVLEDGRHHTFAQFGSGTLAGVTTLLSRYMLVNPLFMEPEARHLEELGVIDPHSFLFIEREALVTTPFHVAANRIRESSRTKRHGSCGMGINETVSYADYHQDSALRVGDLTNPTLTKEKLSKLRDYLVRELSQNLTPDATDQEWHVLLGSGTEEYVERYQEFSYKVNLVGPSFLRDRIQGRGIILFEGAQGVLLDQNYGFFPHVTRSNTATENIDYLVEGHPYTKLGLLRTFLTRHGAGPFPTEDFFLKVRGDHNQWGPWQQSFRAGHFDLVLADYAIRMCRGIDALGLTWTDAFHESVVATNYNRGGQEVTKLLLGQASAEFLEECLPVYSSIKSFPYFQYLLETCLKVPIQLYSDGPTAEDKLWKPSLLGL